MSKISVKYNKTKKKLSTKTHKKINLKIFKSLLKIFPFLKVRIKGFITSLLVKKRYILLYRIKITTSIFTSYSRLSFIYTIYER